MVCLWVEGDYTGPEPGMRILHSATAPRSGGGYHIVREIASGGMATVYLAERAGPAGPREVAVKRLHPHLAQEDEFVTMFFDEARLASRIRHPNVVGVLEVDDDDALSIVMEYVKGVTLLDLARDQARRGLRIPAPVVTRIALDTLSGLHAAHELLDDKAHPLHIVHRDVSPHNILVGVDGITRITDFGIAKASVRLSVTRDGQTKGKLAYMAPEQFEAAELDRRVDLFTMGVVLWEVFTGRRLFKNAPEAAVIHALLHTDLPRMRSIDDALPEALDAVIMRAMARRPDDRWATAAEFAVALRKVLVPAPRLEVGRLAAQSHAHFLTHKRDRASQAPSASDVRAVGVSASAPEPEALLAIAVDEEPTAARGALADDEATRVTAADRTDPHLAAPQIEAVEDAPTLTPTLTPMFTPAVLGPPSEPPLALRAEAWPEPPPAPAAAPQPPRRVGLALALAAAALVAAVWFARGRAPSSPAPVAAVGSRVAEVRVAAVPQAPSQVAPAPAPPAPAAPSAPPARAMAPAAPRLPPARPAPRGVMGLSRTRDGRLIIR